MKAYLIASLLGTLWMLVACNDGGAPPEPTSATVSQIQVEATTTVQPVDQPTVPPATVAIAAEDTTTPENQPAEQDSHGDASTTQAPTPAVKVEAPAEPARDIRTFVIVPDQTQASYIVAEEFLGGALDRLGIQPGLVDTIGRTQEVEGTMQLDFNNLAAPVVANEFSVNLRSLASDQPRRDNRIREANLESNRYPLAQFAITSLVNTPVTYADGEDVAFQANGNIDVLKIQF